MRRRIASTTATTVVALLGLLFLLPPAAQAHGDTVKVVVTGHREGRVTADITWENDGDPVEETVAATVNAVGPGGSRTLGPWRLVRDAGTSPAAWTTVEALPPGNWKVSVDVGFPALGHGELELSVPVVDPAPVSPSSSASASSPSPASSSAPAYSSAAAPAPRPEPEPAADASRSGLWWTTAGVAGLALAGAAAGILIRRRRPRRGNPPHARERTSG